jgi:hypothetical protein
LEDGEHGKTKVVKVGDAILWTFPKLATLVAGSLIALVVTTTERRIVLINHFSCGKKKKKQ